MVVATDVMKVVEVVGVAVVAQGMFDVYYGLLLEGFDEERIN